MFVSLGFLPMAPLAQALSQGLRPAAQAAPTPSPPTIDGDLSDEVWALAQPIGPLTEVEPIEGGVPKDATEVRILFDSEAIYLGIRCFDSDPAGLISTTMERDGFFDSDDRIELILDTFLDRRNAFFFQVNPAGSKGDALITGNGQNFNKPWDGIWSCKTSVDALGWTVEMAVPYKTLNFREGLGTWGFNLDRVVGRRNERQRWANPSRDFGLFRIFQAGDLEGLFGMEHGLGLDVAPFLLARHLDARGDDPREGWDFDAGLDAFFKITPNLTASLTINTDFAETEVDERQVNLTRFPLFFPERRDFFLQDSGLFNFGNQGRRLVPFFSRTIGLAAGEPVPIEAGLKLTGRIGAYTLGVLDVQTDRLDAIDGQNLFAARVSRDVGKQSSIGAIVTSGNPNGGADNTLVGMDANFRSSDLFDGRELTANVWGLVSDSQGVDEDQAAFGASVFFPNDLWNWGVGWSEIQENFNPALGFVPRRGIRILEAEFAYNPRPGTHIRQYQFEAEASVVTDTQDRLQTGEFELQPFGLEWESGDELHFEINSTEERLDSDFEIRDGIVIPQSDYEFVDFRIEFESAVKREWSIDARITQGEFFDGDRLQVDSTLLWQPGPEYSASLGFEHNDISLQGGDFIADVARLRVTRSFAPNLTWNNLVQWDSESKTFGWNSRLRWIPQPGQEIFVVFNHSAEDLDGSLDRVFQELAFKVVYTLRF